MKKFVYFLCALLVSFTHLGYLHSSNQINCDRYEINKFDQQIYDLFKSETFKKLSLNYIWEGKSYPVHFIYNPERETLWETGLSEVVRWPFAMTIDSSSYPIALAMHLKSLVPDDLLKDSDSIIDVSHWVTYFRKYSVSVYIEVVGLGWTNFD